MDSPWKDRDYHPVSEQIVDILRKHTQNTTSDTYFRVLAGFFMAQMASSMRANVVTKDRGEIPINTYVCALMESGAGKGHSLNIMEDSLVNRFKQTFTEHTFPTLSEQALIEEAQNMSIRKAKDYDECLEKVQKEFYGLGAMPYSFSEGTGPAYKQVRTKAQMAKIGSLNYICDEIGSNLLNAQELFTVCLETYDVGKVKDKITKSSSDNIRAEQRHDPVPSNMLVFGTPAKVFNGAKEESEFISLQETGYARRFLFGFGGKTAAKDLSAEDLYDLLSSKSSVKVEESLSKRFGKLADVGQHNRKIIVDRPVGVALLQYKIDCEKLAENYGEHEHILKAEMQHRYFKALKLAGAYAFVDCTAEITLDQLYAAIKLVEDSGEAFKQIMNRPKNYVRLAKYIGSVGTEVTQADLVEALPFYKGSTGAKADMITLAQSWGLKNNIMIKKFLNGSIEMFSGESLKENDLTEMIMSASTQLGEGYTNFKQPWNKIGNLFKQKGYHWVNHHCHNGIRREDAIMPGFNMIVLDVDGGISLSTAKMLLQDYRAIYYTTKSHTEEHNRFRIILPLEFELNLDAADFKEFMLGIYDWLPFKVDNCSTRSKKWLTNPNQVEYVEGNLFDPLPFIPKTSKNEEHVEQVKALKNLDSAERYFAGQMVLGNRNNTFFKFAAMLRDSGASYEDVETTLVNFNKKLSDPLSEEELNNTVLKSIASKYVQNQP